MTRRSVSLLAALGAAFSLTACGGGSSSSTPVVPQTGASSTPTITQAFQVTLPATTTSTATLRQPKDLSPNTGSIAIALQSVNGQPTSSAPTVVKLAAGAPGCATTNNVTVCTINAAAATGVDVFAVSTYQSSTGAGSVLAATTIAANVPSGGGASAIPLTLGGVPAKIAFSPSSLPLVNDGALHRFPVTLEAIDASGATIVGAAAYQSAVSLQILSDPTHALSLSTASVTQPGTVVTVTFDGSKQLADATIEAQATSVPTATLAAAPLNVAPSPVLVYDDQVNGVPVTLSQVGFTGGFTASAADAQDASVALAAGPLQSGSAVATVVPKTTFDVTTLNVGNGIFSYGVPLQIVPHNGTYQAIGNAHQLMQPASTLVQGPDGNFWTGDAYTGAIVKFDPATGTYTPTVVDPSDSGPLALAFDANGNIWFADGSRIGEYTPGSGAVQFFSTGLQSNSEVRMIIAGAPGTMWFYDEGANGTATPSGKPTYFGTINTATGAITEYPTGNGAAPVIGPMSMILGPDGAVWFTDGYRLAIGRVDPTSGAVTEYPTSTPSYPVTSPMKLVVAPDNTIWFLATETQTGAGLAGTISTNGTIQQFALPSGGIFTALAVGADHNLWYGVDPEAGIGYASQSLLGVINPATHAAYTYPAITPDFAAISGIIDRGDRTLWIFDTGFGQIGKVPFT
jgi:streptogramin lyase